MGALHQAFTPKRNRSAVDGELMNRGNPIVVISPMLGRQTAERHVHFQ